MKKLLSMLVIFLSAVFVLIACSSGDSDTSTTEADSSSTEEVSEESSPEEEEIVESTEELADAIMIITGRYGQGTPEETEMVASILGGENSQERFNAYFNWFNIVHEVGHIVSDIIGNEFDYQSAEGFFAEERFANAFAVAFWAHFGDEETLDLVREAISHAAEYLEPPAAEIENLSDFAEIWTAGELEFSFENYGWFQFNMVSEVLNDMRDLETLLADHGFELTEGLPQQDLTFSSIGENDISEILAEVFTVLSELGIEMPADIYHVLSPNPNDHMVIPVSAEDLVTTRDQVGLDAGVSTTEILQALISIQLGDIEVIHIWEVGD